MANPLDATAAILLSLYTPPVHQERAFPARTNPYQAQPRRIPGLSETVEETHRLLCSGHGEEAETILAGYGIRSNGRYVSGSHEEDQFGIILAPCGPLSELMMTAQKESGWCVFVTYKRNDGTRSSNIARLFDEKGYLLGESKSKMSVDERKEIDPLQQETLNDVNEFLTGERMQQP